MIKLHNILNIYPSSTQVIRKQNTTPPPSLKPLDIDTVNFTCKCQKPMSAKIDLFSGNANPGLAEEIAKSLDVKVGNRTLKKFADGETYVRINDNVQGKDVYLVQPSANPVNDNIFELLLMTDAVKRADAKQVIAVIPYMGYERQDRKVEDGEPIAAKLHADMLTHAGVDKVITVDLHAAQIEGFYNNTHVINISSIPVFSEYIKNKKLDNIVIVSPDAGGVKRAQKLADQLDCSYASIHKKREGHNQVKAVSLVGDIKGKNCILFDDMVDTAGTIVEAAKMLKENGAKSVYVCAAHGLFSGPAYERLDKAPIEEVIVTNTLPLKPNPPEKIKQINIAPLIADAIKKISGD